MRRIKNAIYLLGLSWRRLVNGRLTPHEQWRVDRGDYTYRLDYPLNAESVVIDAGAYTGDWSAQIIQRYDPKMYLFEPVSRYANDLANRFASNPKVVIRNVALGACDGTARISNAADASSISTIKPDEGEQIQIRDVHDAIQEHSLSKIDLLKLNVEGSEYEIIPRLFEKGMLTNIEHIQVQFHPFPSQYLHLYQECQDALNKTHDRIYYYPFVWEGWRRKRLASTPNAE